MRMGEILALQWRHVDLQNRVATLPDTKTGDCRQVPLSNWGFVQVDEIAPRDTTDLKEIYKWQDMAEPGVHAKPMPFYRVRVVGKDGEDLLAVHEGQDMTEALEIKKLLTNMLAAREG